MFFVLVSLWFFRAIKYVLFWLYLWQLKEYHIGRFLDHFSTYKGKKLVSNPLQGFKILLVVVFLFSQDLFAWLLFSVYLAESFLFLKAIFQRRVKKPVITFKTAFLLLILLFVTFLFPIFLSFSTQNEAVFYFWLLVFDILMPVVVSAVVLLFQPFTVFSRNKTLAKAKKKMESFPNLIVIAVTGSYGKTTTKEILSTILSKNFNVLKTKEHQNSEMGIAGCILKDLKPEHEVFVVEMGAYKKGGIKMLADIVKPRIGIITGVNEQHLSLFKSMDNLLSAEGGVELIKALPKDGLIVFNGDNKYCLDLYRKTNIKKNIYAEKRDKIDTDVWAEDVAAEKDSISFLAMQKNMEAVPFKVNVLGRQNIQNILGAVLVARRMGMNLQDIAEAAKNIKQEQGGMVLKQGKHGINIIDSTYSANPDGVKADLEYLKIFNKKKVIVMPSLIELGGKSKELHEKIGKTIARVCDMAIITTKDRFEDIKKGAIEGGMKKANVMFCDNPADLAMTISLFCTSGDAVLLEGRIPAEVIKLLSE